MKKIILLFAMFLSVQFSFAQDEKEKTEETKPSTGYNNIGGSFLLSDFSNISIFWEEDYLPAKTFILRGGFSSATLTNGFSDVTGNGSTTEIAFREYFGKNKNDFKGFFAENALLSYTSIEFDEDFYRGKYQHISFFNPTIGYKFQWGDLTLDGRAGYQWVIMLKGKGDVDNNIFNPWIFNMGLQLGYAF